MSASVFFRELMKNWREVGSVVPSSSFLVRKMLSKIDFISARLVVELGPGTGPMTKEILSLLHPDGRLIVIESNEIFCRMLREISDSRLSVECTSAAELSRVLEGEKADAIVSGLPLAVIDCSTVKKILEGVKQNLVSGGIFVQFQYSLASKKLLKTYFETGRVDFTPANVPPAFVYSAWDERRE